MKGNAVAKPESRARNLKDRLHAKADAHSDASRTRLHCAISWLARSETERDDPDAQFAFLWIAFNAAYAKVAGEDEPARTQLAGFFSALLALDTDMRLSGCYVESFNGRLRDECLNEHWFIGLLQARTIIETWRREYNEERPKKALGGLTPAAYAKQLTDRLQ